jgi:hypothetical protein
MGSKRRILEFLLANIGRVLESDEIREASGNVSEWTRRVRELRDEEGYDILTNNDLRELKPGQYLMRSDTRRPAFARGISKETRAWVLERNGYTCRMCGLGAGDPDPFDAAKKVRLVMGHIVDKSLGGGDGPDNLRAVCTNCNEGLQNTSPPKPDRMELMRQLRRATIADQEHARDWLEQRLGPRHRDDHSPKP